MGMALPVPRKTTFMHAEFPSPAPMSLRDPRGERHRIPRDASAPIGPGPDLKFRLATDSSQYLRRGSVVVAADGNPGAAVRELVKGGTMKKTMLAAIKTAKAKGSQKRGRRRSRPQRKDPKDLRGAKGVLLKSAIDAVREEELSDTQGAGPRHPPIRIRSDS
jgi:hypothetical protein